MYICVCVCVIYMNLSIALALSFSPDIACTFDYCRRRGASRNLRCMPLAQQRARCRTWPHSADAVSLPRSPRM